MRLVLFALAISAFGQQETRFGPQTSIAAAADADR